LRWIGGVKPKPKAVTTLSHHCIMHGLDKPGVFTTVSIMAGYTEDAVLITPNGVLKGHAQIRALYKQVFTDMFPSDSTSLEMSQQVIEGEIAYILWSARSSYYHCSIWLHVTVQWFVTPPGTVDIATYA